MASKGEGTVPGSPTGPATTSQATSAAQEAGSLS